MSVTLYLADVILNHLQMPLFCEANELKETEEFNTTGGPTLPSQLKISHVSPFPSSFRLQINFR